MESIDKLREYGHDCCARVDDAIHDCADAIEAEIAERYIPLPLDADGVPCKVGDMVEFHGREYEVFGVSEGGVYVNNGGCWMMLFPRGDMHHVKPRTIEDVLGDLIDLCYKTFGSSCMFERDKREIIESGNFEAFADEIRGMK